MQVQQKSGQPRHVLHRDLKPGNFFISNGWENSDVGEKRQKDLFQVCWLCCDERILVEGC